MYFLALSEVVEPNFFLASLFNCASSFFGISSPYFSVMQEMRLKMGLVDAEALLLVTTLALI